jgi:dihydroorotase
MLSLEGIIVENKELARRRIEINTETGLIERVTEPTGKADVVFSNELIFPGFIDLHVHAREDASHTQEYKEDFTTAGQAAAYGGVVAFAEMPNNPVPPVTEITYAEKEALTKKSLASVLLYAGIGAGTKPLSRKVPYKVFMGKSVGDMFFTSREDLEKALENYRGEYVSFHCEDPKIMDAHKDAPTHEAKRPPEAEISAVDIAIACIEKFNLHGKICHASTVEAIEKITEAKKRGLDITVEVTPHHLYFDETMFNEELHTRLQVNPPIRQTKENRLALIAALKDGRIDYLATDHAPHTLEEKAKGISGMPHLDTYGAFTSWLMYTHNFSPFEIARVCSQNPANFLSHFMPEKYGEIKEGFIGSLTIIDMQTKEMIAKETLKTKSGWSPFEDITFPGRVAMTVIKGEVYGN